MCTGGGFVFDRKVTGSMVGHSFQRGKPEPARPVPGAGGLPGGAFGARKTILLIQELAIQLLSAAISPGVKVFPRRSHNASARGHPKVTQAILENGMHRLDGESRCRPNSAYPSVPPAPYPIPARPHPHRAVRFGLEAQDVSKRLTIRRADFDKPILLPPKNPGEVRKPGLPLPILSKANDSPSLECSFPARRCERLRTRRRPTGDHPHPNPPPRIFKQGANSAPASSRRWNPTVSLRIKQPQAFPECTDQVRPALSWRTLRP